MSTSDNELTRQGRICEWQINDEAQVAAGMRDVTNVMPKQEFDALVKEQAAAQQGASHQTTADSKSAARASAEDAKQGEAWRDGAPAQWIEGARTAAGRTDRFVRGSPWKAVGIATGMGMIIGLVA